MIPYSGNLLGINFKKFIDNDDVKVLRSIRDLNPGCPVTSEWLDTIDPLTWKGVVWNNNRVISLNLWFANIVNMPPLYNLTELSELFLANSHNLTTANITDKLYNLTKLSLANSKVDTINFSTNTKLTSIELDHSAISGSLDLSYCPNLVSITCGYTNITSINLNNCYKIAIIKVDHCKLSQLDTTNKPNLNNVYCNNNYINSLSFLGSPNMAVIECNDNQITNINLTNTTRIGRLIVNNNLLLDIPTLTNKQGIIDNNYYNFTGNFMDTSELNRLRFVGYNNESKLVPQNILNDKFILKCIRDSNPSNTMLQTLWTDKMYSWWYSTRNYGVLTGQDDIETINEICDSLLITRPSAPLDQNSAYILSLYKYDDTTNIEFLPGLEYLKDLVALMIGGCEIKGLQNLSYLENLEALMIENTSLTKIPIDTKGRLESVSFKYNMLPLDEINRLRSMGFSDDELLPQK